LVRAIDQRIGTLNDFNFSLGLIQPGDIGIILPKLLAQCADIHLKAPWVMFVEVAHGGSQHDDIAGR
jgi:hypothetical protein